MAKVDSCYLRGPSNVSSKNGMGYGKVTITWNSWRSSEAEAFGPAEQKITRLRVERGLVNDEQSRSDTIVIITSQIGTNARRATAVAITGNEMTPQVFCHMSES